MDSTIGKALRAAGGIVCLLAAAGTGAGPPLQAPAPRSVLASPSVPASSLATAAAGPMDAALRHASISVAQAPARPAEFPPATAGQVKVAFECRIGLAKPQVDFSRFPRVRCEIDRARTVQLNGLRLARADSFFSGDGMTTKTVLVYEKNALVALPAKIRAAFQLYQDSSAVDSRSLLADVVYADAVIDLLR